MTLNNKHRWVFPLDPNACAYANLDGYFFGKYKPERFRSFNHRAALLESQEERKVSKPKQNSARNRMGNFTKIITNFKGLMQNSHSKAARMASGPSDEIPNIGNLGEVRKLCNWRGVSFNWNSEGEGDSENRREKRKIRKGEFCYFTLKGKEPRN